MRIARDDVVGVLLPKSRRAVARMHQGALYGALVGIVYSVIALFLAVVKSSAVVERQVPFGIGLLIVLYLAGGTAGGAIVGLLLPLARWRWGAFLVGAFATFPLALGITYFLTGPGEFWPLGIASAIVLAVVLGGGFGVVVRDDPPRL